VSVWLSLALGLIQLVNMIMTRLDASEKEKAMRKMVESENLKADLAAIALGKATAEELRKQLDAFPNLVNKPDKDMRP
jgi:hypothetical protein